MVVTLYQEYNVGEKPTFILYNYMNRHAGTQKKTRTKDAISLDYNSICNIGSRIGWALMKEMF